MSWIFGLLPAASLLFSNATVCRPAPFVWQPPGWVFGAVWTGLAVTTGFSGWQLYEIADTYAISLFVLLCWLFGIGWETANRVCNQGVTAAYVAATLLTAWLLFDRLQTLQSTQRRAKFTQTMLVPLLIWLCVALILATWAFAAWASVVMRQGKLI